MLYKLSIIIATREGVPLKIQLGIPEQLAKLFQTYHIIGSTFILEESIMPVPGIPLLDFKEQLSGG